MFCILIVSLVGAYVTYTAIRESTPEKHATVAFCVGFFLFCVMSFWARGASRRLFFPAAYQFRPTIERLSDQIVLLRDMAEVRDTVQGLVKRWLPTHTARVIEPRELAEVEKLPSNARERLARGVQVWTDENPWQRHLLVPMCSLGELRGVLMVAPKEGAALFTQDDLSLLGTMASLSAVALHHAEVLQEVDRLRRLELETARDEKRRVLDLLSAEISHEIGHPLGFIRYLLEQISKKVPLSHEDVETGRDEVERLERMRQALRRMKLPSPKLEPTHVLPPVQRALGLIREQLRTRRIQVEVEVPAELRVIADADPLVQLFSNLLRNAAEAAGEEGRVGVRSLQGEESLLLEVWDTGQGVPKEATSRLFQYSVSSKEGGMGIGLAISKRIVRDFSWDIQYHREAGRTCFRIFVPQAHVVPLESSQEKP
ncbi:sensor histidine kinase [Hyalangium versicolor]|uniref:sensor histidine kinase n=1 Tax=Hyalangium versicolor TaxID=2861190 RepID=UPI001CCA1070|nr:HAMP domain-containing sensor histidine kinase [Hyalangium versicolor]